MGEGATEYWVFAEVARSMGIDLERNGIRIVPYRQVEADTFAKVANDLGIPWFCLTDGDDEGRRTRKSLLPCLAGRAEADCISMLPCATIELLLCNKRRGSAYEAHMSSQKMGNLKVARGHLDYWPQVLSCIPNKASKEQMAIDAMMLMRRKGPSAVPDEIKDVINRAATLANS